MHTPDVIQQILSEIANWNLKNVKFWGMDEGVLPPMTPINPYLGGNAWKKWATFYLSVHLCTLCKPHFGAKYGPRGPPRAIYEPGGPGCCRDTYSIERVKRNNRKLFHYRDVIRLLFIFIWLDYISHRTLILDIQKNSSGIVTLYHIIPNIVLIIFS